MHKTETHKKKALLVGLELPGLTENEVHQSLDELSRLVTTLGYLPIHRFTQKRNSEKNATVLGDGKLKEISRWTGGSGVVKSSFVKKKPKAVERFKKNLEEQDDLDDDFESEKNSELIPELDDSAEDQDHSSEVTETADVVVFDCDLSPSQLRNLESAFGCEVLDRTGVIIEIFSRHAKTKAARLQVEIARLTYVAPRLRETGGGGDRQGGGIGGKGSGETSLELDRRHIRDRIKELKTELASIGHEHETRRARRQKEITVALVGYTNAGKSSLMRAMTGSQVLVADQLFATLDTTVRPLFPETLPKILVSDTVGFIKKLPHDLVASFKSTLDEALYASLLLYVVDSSDPSFRSQLDVTRTVLSEVGAEGVPSRLVLNKIDCITPEQLTQLKQEFPEGLFISTRSPDDLKSLRETLVSEFEKGMVDQKILIEYSKAGGVLGELRSRFRVLSEAHNEKGYVFKVRGFESDLEQFRRQFKI